MHGFYGVSVFLAIGMTVEDLVARTPEQAPDRYKQLRTSTVGVLQSAGFWLLVAGSLCPGRPWTKYSTKLRLLALLKSAERRLRSEHQSDRILLYSDPMDRSKPEPSFRTPLGCRGVR